MTTTWLSTFLPVHFLFNQCSYSYHLMVSERVVVNPSICTKKWNHLLACWISLKTVETFCLKIYCYLTEKRSLKHCTHNQLLKAGWGGQIKCHNTDKQADNADGPDNHKQNTSWLISWEAQSVWCSTGMLSLPLKS